MIIVCSVVVFSLLCAGALFAADMPDTNMNATHAAMIDRASTIIGMAVQDPQGEKLGSINDVTFDNTTGRVAYAVLGAGGVLGVGEKFYAIPWTALTFNAGANALILNVDKDKLKTAPSFDKNNWPDFTDQAWGASIYRFYGQQPYWTVQPSQ